MGSPDDFDFWLGTWRARWEGEGGPAQGENTITKRFGGNVRSAVVTDGASAAAALQGASLLLNTGPAGVQLVPRAVWAGAGLAAVADLNAVPPLGIEGVEVTDNASDRDGAKTFGALGVGGLKMKIHKACIARLFEKNDLVLDAETIADVAGDLVAPKS